MSRKNQKVRVTFYAQRHGDKDGDALTPKGRGQVRRSATKYLSDVRFVKGFSSFCKRAISTTNIALRASGNANTPRQPDMGFDFRHSVYDRFPASDAVAYVNAAIATGARNTISLWLGAWPTFIGVRARFTECMFRWANILVLSDHQQDIIVYVGTHSPGADACVLDPDNTLRLQPAGIMKYVVEVDPKTNTVELVESTVIFEGYPE
ncbi:hypothetical protein KKG41_04090 [Patescibacteria group bacterium]|nr:hypothetical protein [Patescibacteria group bacterium]MBU1891136.1 hypothetical protein [Patescibacteria group bacterium]